MSGPSLKAGVNTADWPAEFKDVGAQFTGRQPVPSFAVVVDRKVVLHQFGYQFWEPRVAPLLREVLSLRGSAVE